VKRNRFKTPKSGLKEENDILNRIELKTECKRELKQLTALMRLTDFPTNVKIQNKASLIARGIVIKMRVLKTETGDDKVLFEMATAIVRDFGTMFNRKTVNLQPPQKPEEILLNMVESEGRR
jgi:hypothetical protein